MRSHSAPPIMPPELHRHSTRATVRPWSTLAVAAHAAASLTLGALTIIMTLSPAQRRVCKARHKMRTKAQGVERHRVERRDGNAGDIKVQNGHLAPQHGHHIDQTEPPHAATPLKNIFDTTRSRCTDPRFCPAGVSVHSSLTSSSTILQWRSKARTRAKSLWLLRRLMRTCVLLRTDFMRTDNGPFASSSCSVNCVAAAACGVSRFESMLFNTVGRGCVRVIVRVQMDWHLMCRLSLTLPCRSLLRSDRNGNRWLLWNRQQRMTQKFQTWECHQKVHCGSPPGHTVTLA